MFGYINIYKDELKVKDYNIFKSYYCGLCKALGKRYNQVVRLGLNYDFTFLAILADAMYDEKTETQNLGCIKSIGKKQTVVNNNAVDFCSDMSIILTYYKLLDDIRDDKSIKAALAIVPYFFAKRKLKGKYSDLIISVQNNLNELTTLEKEKSDSLDGAAHPFAQIMADMFELASPSLRIIGYNLGRYVYFADALDDMDSDLKKGNYNVLNIVHSYNGNVDENIKDSIRQSLYLTLGAIAAEYEKLPKFKNKDVLDNIIYIGVRAKSDVLLTKLGQKQRKDESINE